MEYAVQHDGEVVTREALVRLGLNDTPDLAGRLIGGQAVYRDGRAALLVAECLKRAAPSAFVAVVLL